MRCAPCPVPPDSPCLGPALGLCPLLAGPAAAAWSRHVVARSQLPPPGAAPDPAEAARRRRAGKPRVPLGCGPCHGKM